MTRISLFFILAIVFLIPSCTKECCFDGELIDPATEEEILNENENNDPTFAAQFNGLLSCPNDAPISGLSLVLDDEFGNQKIFNSNERGDFEFSNLQEGEYNLTFIDPEFYSYTEEEYDEIIQRMDAIILGAEEATSIDSLAYNVVNFEDGITTLDKLYFQRLRDGDLTFDEIDFPWRYVFKESFSTQNIITDSLSFSLEEGEKLDLEIMVVFIGDTEGQICN